MLPWAHPRPYSKQHLDQISCCCTVHGRESLYFTMGHPLTLKIALAHGGYGPPSNTCFLGPTLLSIPNTILIGSPVFAQLTAVCPYTFPLKIAPLHGGLDPHLIHGSLGPPEFTTQTASRPFSRFCRAYDRPTDHVTSVTIGRIYVCSIGKRPNSNIYFYVFVFNPRDLYYRGKK